MTFCRDGARVAAYSIPHEAEFCSRVEPTTPQSFHCHIFADPRHASSL